VSEDDPELVAADAAGDVRRAHDRADPLRDLRQHRVAGEMADAVVYRLEVVEVENDERKAPSVPVSPRHLAAERVVEEAPVV
jgi:hypothetical protein